MSYYDKSEASSMKALVWTFLATSMLSLLFSIGRSIVIKWQEGTPFGYVSLSFLFLILLAVSIAKFRQYIIDSQSSDISEDQEIRNQTMLKWERDSNGIHFKKMNANEKHKALNELFDREPKRYESLKN